MTHAAAAKLAGQASTAHGRAGRRSHRLLATLALVAGLLGEARAQDEVPFITTPDRVTLAMLQLAGVTANDFVVDLGSGDGRIVITAARRFGARGLGVEIDPELVSRSRDNARVAGVADRAEFRVQDLFETDLSAAQVITLYLLPEVNLQLRPRLLALAPGTRIVSHDWDMGDWLADRQLTLDVPEKAIGREKRSTVHLWVVPAAVQGLWCTAGASLAISQRFQAFSATLSTSLANPGTAAPLLVFDGRVVADHLHAGSASQAAPQLLRQLGDTLLWLRSSGPTQHFEGRRFERAGPQGCR
ncbi:MAG: class I SAM-dependent methyltransferase [Microbacteriaceae bacterium]|nr:class I SAM-dependent methyltransferase [Burkholderiaceae bacterium]